MLPREDKRFDGLDTALYKNIPLFAINQGLFVIQMTQF